MKYPRKKGYPHKKTEESISHEPKRYQEEFLRFKNVYGHLPNKAEKDELRKIRDSERGQPQINWLNRRKKSATHIGSKGINKTKKAGGIAWRNKGKVINRSINATQKGSMALANFGYAMPGPVQIFTYGWRKMTRSLKALITIVFALVLLFVPWGVFLFAGWSVGVAFMFLVSLLFWVFTSLFNSIAYGAVALINGISSMFLGIVVYVVEAVLGFLGMSSWENGRYLMENGLINYDQIASIPSLYEIITPEWTDSMNTTIISKVLTLLGFNSESFSIFSGQFEAFYIGLEPLHAMIIGLSIILIPIAYLLIVYYKNRARIIGMGG